ncbi:hypothetical protein NP493_627g01019 [Ridgeia piscesae]|uniref:Uncharacterized protein n=1 Tax=Ridgeia piscesae TaxID=27915 RepID=A0AAD9NQM1_RIDPI|nr:hypothetical protein NP493_627g01019 [Ridgeia piscesae]
MASHRERFSSGGTLVEGKKGDGIFVFDRRKGDSDEVSLELDGLTNFKTFRDKIRQIFSIADNDTYVITTTSREEIKDDESWGFVEAGDTLYILQNVTQELTAQAHERVNYLPHYDTIVKGGMYEYYASEGQNPLPYAIAELIDNALAATAENVGPRNIEIRLHLDENYPSRNMVIVLDNGKGMTSPQLNNWAIYRLSKFIRRERKGHGSDGEVSLLPNAPRSLNSDISYFGVGGKQAIFFIGNSTRMITRGHGSKDVHEMKISKDDFEQKEKNHEAIYSGYIRNRMPGDTTHVVNEDDFLKAVIEEEVGKESFTTVVISGINPTHVPYLKTYMTQWTRQLAYVAVVPFSCNANSLM